MDIGTLIATIKADVTNFKKGVDEVSKNTNAISSAMVKLGGVIATTFAVSKIIGFGKEASQAAIDYERAIISLEIVTEKYGINTEEATTAAMRLGKELRIGVGPAASGLQNLLKGGLSLPDATALMERFTNEAITGKSSTISLAQAVENLTFGYVTNNSAIGNNSGMSENWSTIIDAGREALIAEGVAIDDITEDMAKFRGTMDVTNLTLGASERFTGTLVDKQAELDIKLQDLKVRVGESLNPVLAVFVDLLAQWADKILWVVENKDILIEKIMKFKDEITIVATFLAITFTPAIILLGIESLKTATVGMASLIIKTVLFAVEGWKTIAMLLVKIVQLGIASAAFIFHTATTIASTVATTALTAATWLLNAAIAVLTSPITLVIAAIVALIAIGVLLWKNWDTIKAFGKQMLDELKVHWESFVTKLREVGGKILDAIMQPFNSAKEKIEGIVNWIKDKLDWTQRHSPSVIDIIEKGVKLANQAYEGLDTGIEPVNKTLLSNSTAVGVGAGGNQILIDMGGANISSPEVADEYGEKIGDAIINRLGKVSRSYR